MRVAVSCYIITHWRCKCPFHYPCFSLYFCLNVFIRVRLYCDWLYVYRYNRWSSFCLSFSLSISVSGYIMGNFMYMNKRVQLSQRVKALWIYFLFYFFIACIRTSLDSYFCLSLFLRMSVTVSGYIMTYCMSIYLLALRLCLSFCLNICISVGLYYHRL